VAPRCVSKGTKLKAAPTQLEPEGSTRSAALGPGLTLVFLVALVYRAVAWFQGFDSAVLQEPVLDAKLYADAGAALASGQGLGERPYFISPGYAWFVAVHAWLFGPQQAWVTATQCVLDSFTCAITALATARVLGRFAGLSAGLLLALHGTQVFFCLRLLPATLGTFVAAVLLLLLVGVEAKPRGRRLFLSGLALGVHACIRANALLLLPLVALWLWWRDRGAGAALHLRRIGLLVAGVALLVLPVTLRNWIVGGDLVLLTSNGGVNFYIGNAAGGDGRFLSLNHLPLAPGSFSDLQFERSVEAYVEEVEGRDMRPSEISRYWVGLALDEIADDPGAWLALLGRKLAFSLNGFEVPQIDNLYFMSRYLPVLDGVAVHSSRLLWTLGLVGLLLLTRRRPVPLVPFLLFGAYLASTLLFFVTARYRLPVVPVIALGGGAALVALRDALRGGVPRPVPAFAALLVGCALVVNLNPRLFSRAVHAAEDSPGWRSWLGVDAAFLGLAEQHNNMAARYRARGDAERVEQELRRGLELAPDDPSLLFNLGRVLEERAELTGSRAAYERVLELQPDNPDAGRLLGRLLFLSREYEAAAAVLRESLRVRPENPESWNTLGGVQTELGELDAALESFGRAVELAPAWDNPLYNQARLLVRVGRADEALPDLESLHESAPKSDVYGYAYAEALVEIGVSDPAGEVLDEFLSRYDQDYNALVLRARVELLRGYPEKARPYAERAQGLGRDGPELRAVLEEIAESSTR